MFIIYVSFVNGAQTLNATLVLASTPDAVLSPVTRIYMSEYSQRFDLMTWVSNLTVYHFHFLHHNLCSFDH